MLRGWTPPFQTAAPTPAPARSRGPSRPVAPGSAAAANFPRKRQLFMLPRAPPSQGRAPAAPVGAALRLPSLLLVTLPPAWAAPTGPAAPGAPPTQPPRAPPCGPLGAARHSPPPDALFIVGVGRGASGTESRFGAGARLPAAGSASRRRRSGPAPARPRDEAGSAPLRGSAGLAGPRRGGRRRRRGPGTDECFMGSCGLTREESARSPRQGGAVRGGASQRAGRSPGRGPGRGMGAGSAGLGRRQREAGARRPGRRRRSARRCTGAASPRQRRRISEEAAAPAGGLGNGGPCWSGLGARDRGRGGPGSHGCASLQSGQPPIRALSRGLRMGGAPLPGPLPFLPH